MSTRLAPSLRLALQTRRACLTASMFSLVPAIASAQTTPVAPTGAPPPDATALVTPAPAPLEAPALATIDATSASLSAGGLLTTGNSRLLALTANGTYETRFDNNGIGASVLANYGQGAPAGSDIQVTAENIQGRLRYDRYVSDQTSVFLINTLRHDRFQGLDLRYNLDPGAKYIFTKEADQSFWGEGGYDFQYDIRRESARTQTDATTGAVLLDATGQALLLDKTRADHSIRLFTGYKYAFNKEVTFSTGLEYLQSVVASTRYRLNLDAVIAANLGGGLALGLGFSARYDHDPIPGKENLDTSSTVSLIYAFSNAAPATPKAAKSSPEAQSHASSDQFESLGNSADANVRHAM